MREEWEQDGEKALVYFFGRVFFFNLLLSRKVSKCPITSKESNTYQTVVNRITKTCDRETSKKIPPAGWCGVSCCSGRDLTWKPRGQLKVPRVTVGIVQGERCCVPWFRYCGAAFVLHDRKPPGRQLETAQIRSLRLLNRNPDFVFSPPGGFCGMERPFFHACTECSWIVSERRWRLNSRKQTNFIPKGGIVR